MAYQANRSLDNVPTRNQRTLQVPRGHSSRLGQADVADQSTQTVSNVSSQGVQSSAPQPDQESYSPTSSDIDALNESFFEFDIQSSVTEGETSSKSASQNASSVNYTQITRSQSPTSILSQSSSMNDLELHMPDSIEDRLQIIWRKLAALFLMLILTSISEANFFVSSRPSALISQTVNLTTLIFLNVIMIIEGKVTDDETSKDSSWAGKCSPYCLMGSDSGGTRV